MENIRIVKSESYHFICDEIKYHSTNRAVLKELGEYLLVNRGQTWLFAYEKGDTLPAGFLAYMENKILYAYVNTEYRGRGIFSLMYDELPDRPWEVVASNTSYPIFIKKGFKVVKNYKSCHKLIKK